MNPCINVLMLIKQNFLICTEKNQRLSIKNPTRSEKPSSELLVSTDQDATNISHYKGLWLPSRCKSKFLLLKRPCTSDKMNLKESKKGYMRGFGWRKGKKKTIKL